MTEQAASSPDALVNLRDLGGLPTDSQEMTKSGIVYRSDAPHLGDRAPDGMAQWPPAAVVDLRDAADEDLADHPLGSRCALYRIPLLENLRSAPGDNTWMSLGDMYVDILERASTRLLELFRVAVNTDGPVLIHCAAGKDRTGVASAVLLRAAGVRSDAIVADYVRTDRNMTQVLARLRVEPVLPPGVDDDTIRELISAPAEAIEAVLARLDKGPDGAAGWLCERGATLDEVTRWKRRFLTPEHT